MKKSFLILMTLLNGSIVQAHNTSPHELHSSNDIKTIRQHNQDNNQQQLQHFFNHYIKHYNDYLHDSSNQEAILKAAKNYHLPAMQIIPNVPVRVINSHQKLATGTQAFLNKLRDSGVDHIKWDKVNIHQLSKKSAIASNIGTRYKKNGEIFNKAAATFMMYKSEEGWKIATLTLHDQANTITFE